MTTLLQAKQYLEKQERRDGAGNAIGGTALTELKLQGSPIARLFDAGKIGTDELRAVEDIEIAHRSIAGDVMWKVPSLEKRDRGHSYFEPVRVIDAVKRYKSWSKFWSERKPLGDYTLAIVWAAVIDHRSFHKLDIDYSVRHGKTANIAACALRDYLARAGWADPRQARAWMDAAESNFKLRKPVEIQK